MKGKTIGIAALVLLVLGALGAWLFHMENYDEFCYVQIQDPKPEEVAGDLSYEYTLECWTASEQPKTLTFKTSEPLENGQILKLEVRAAGVYHFNFIGADEVPSDIRQNVLQN